MRYTHQLMIAFAVGAGIRYTYDATKPKPRVPPVIPARVPLATSYGGPHRVKYRDGHDSFPQGG